TGHRNREGSVGRWREPEIAATRSGPRRRPDAGPSARRSRSPPDPCGRLYGAEQRYGRGVGLFLAPLPDGLQPPFFFLLAPAATRLLPRATRTDPFIEGHEFRAELLKATKLGNLLLRLA